MNISSIQSIRDNIRFQQAMRESFIIKNENLQNNSSSSSQTESLRAKLISGQELTASELEYLQKHDQDLYNKAVKAAQEREAYKNSMHQCRTKSELNDLHNQTMINILNRNKKGDPEAAMISVSAVQDEHRKFMQTDEYDSLDWDNKNKRDKAQRKQHQ